MHDDPYRQVGLRHNPFVAESTPGAADEVFLDVGAAMPEAGEVVEVVGDKGAGKTTHLMRWVRAVDARYHHVGPGPARLVPPPVGARRRSQALAWDEVDRLPRSVLGAQVARARRRGVPLLLGTHVPTGLADVSLRLPVPDVEGVLAFARLRIAAAALPPGVGPAPPTVPRGLAEHTAASAVEGWRDVGSALHAWAARRAAEAVEGRGSTRLPLLVGRHGVGG